MFVRFVQRQCTQKTTSLSYFTQSLRKFSSTTEGEFEEGVVKFWLPKKGYGFITRPIGKEPPEAFGVFAEVQSAESYKVLFDGQAVRYIPTMSEKGCIAKQLTAIGPRPPTTYKPSRAATTTSTPSPSQQQKMDEIPSSVV